MLKFSVRKFSDTRLLYIGLGEMGYHISGTLSKHFPTTVWNRTHSKAERHALEYKTKSLDGGNPFSHDISSIDIIFTCLPSSKEVSMLSDLLIASKTPTKKDLVWVDNTSGVPSESKHIAKRLEANNIGFLDAPVSGGRAGAIAGQLAVMVGGPSAYFNKAAPVLQTISKSLIHIDETVGSGHAVKGYNNLLYGCNILLAMKAAQSLIENGINIDKALKTIMAASGGSFSMTRVHKYTTNNRTIDYNFKTNLLIKDMETGMSMLGTKHDDPVYKIFEQFKTLYINAAKDNWDQSNLFDVYSYIENKDS
jgi:3-hydroxyisobutyrate dehydrogenase